MDKKDSKLTRKPSIKRNPPQVRETKTSKIRLLKSNPLLMHELGIKEITNLKDKDKINLLDLKKTKFEEIRTTESIQNFSRALNDTSSISYSNSNLNSNNNDFKKPKPQTKSIINSMNGLNKPKIFPKTQTTVKDLSSVEIFNKSEHFLSSTRLSNNSKKIDFVKRNIEAAKSRPSINGPRPSIGRILPQIQNGKNSMNTSRTNQVKEVNSKNEKKPLRRSLSAQHFDRKKGKTNVEPESCYFRLEKTNSYNDVNMKSLDHAHAPMISPVIEEKSIHFKTPSAYQRRSTIMRTPNTVNKSHIFASTPAASDLQKRLSDWLKSRGKQFTYHHLKCFGVHHANVVPQTNESKQKEEEDDENKENIEKENCDDDSYEDLKISKSSDSNVDVSEKNLDNIAKEALQDLYNLLLEGYPRDQCEAWLRLIHQKYTRLQEEPQYWEIRAALEQARGNITTAVECYQRAIVEGAEIQQVDESLEQLLQKFSLLNISPKKENAEDRARIVKDARNVFKSSIIQFAVRERTLKNKNGETRKSFVATPVRRSTRLSRSHFTLTPGVKLYSTLKDVEEPIKNDLQFHYNNALQ